MEQNIIKALVLHKTMIQAKLNINIVIDNNLRNAQEIFGNFKIMQNRLVGFKRIFVVCQFLVGWRVGTFSLFSWAVCLFLVRSGCI